MTGVRVMTFGPVSLRSPAAVRDMIRLADNEAGMQQIAVVVSALPAVTEELAGAARLAAVGDDRFDTILTDLEQRHFEVVRCCLPIARQSAVLATVRFHFNQLDDILHGVSVIKELPARTLDKVLSYGDWLSSHIFAEGLKELRPATRLLDTRSIIVTDSVFAAAHIDFPESKRRIREHFDGNTLLNVATGSIGASPQGDTTTLGRGGAEYVASVIAAALAADELTLWTDTDGVMTADPKKVPAAHPIPHLTYVEAMELSHFGDDFIYPPALIPALKHQIPIRVRNAFNPAAAGTRIDDRREAARAVKGVSSIDEIALLQLQGSGMVGVTGVAMRLFRALAEAHVNVILISQASSEHSICVGIVEKDAEQARRVVAREFQKELDADLIDEVSVECGLSIVAAVGENMKLWVGLAARVFQALADAGVNIRAIAQGSSELNVSIVIDRSDQSRALSSLHRSLIEQIPD